MVAPASSTHFPWSFKLGTFIMVNVLDVFDEICEGNIVRTIIINYLFKKIAMVAPASSAHFSLSYELGTFIMVNVLDALDEIFLKELINNNFLNNSLPEKSRPMHRGHSP